MAVEIIHFLEELAANALPPDVLELIDGWRLRFTSGIARRANSVWPNDAYGNIALEEKLKLVEMFYDRYHIPARYQICPAAQPADLDIILARRGYTTDARTCVQTAAISDVTERIWDEPSALVSVQPALSKEWFDFYRNVEQLSDEAATIRHRIFQRLGQHNAEEIHTGYAFAEVEGQPAGIGLGIAERGWLGIFNMLTHPAYRRRGVATSVIYTLAQWGNNQGATHMYLQVMEANHAAQKLYERAGFTTLYHYHYREAGKQNRF